LTGEIGLSFYEKTVSKLYTLQRKRGGRDAKGFSLEINTFSGLWVAIILGTGEYTIQ
jgi:hypothetical protein